MNVLIDLDGTLTDPADGIVACIKHALAAMGRDWPEDAALRRCIGPPLQESFGQLLGSNDPAQIRSAIDLYRERFEAQGMFENVVYPGIPAALDAIKELGATLYVATSKPSVYSEKIVRHFGLSGYFSAVYGSELDGFRSSKAELIAHILKVESLAPSSTCMVGDRSHDVVGAKSNGVYPIGVLWGYGSRDELVAAGAAVLCQQPAALTRAIVGSM